MPTPDPKFTCPSCGKEYRWKPELAGRKAKCKCGHALVVPATPPSASVSTVSIPQPARPIAASESAACPSCGASLEKSAVLCINCGYNLKTGQTLSVVVETDDEE